MAKRKRDRHEDAVEAALGSQEMGFLLDRVGEWCDCVRSGYLTTAEMATLFIAYVVTFCPSIAKQCPALAGPKRVSLKAAKSMIASIGKGG